MEWSSIHVKCMYLKIAPKYNKMYCKEIYLCWSPAGEFIITAAQETDT